MVLTRYAPRWSFMVLLLAACVPEQQEAPPGSLGQVSQEASGGPVVRWAHRQDRSRALRDLPEIVSRVRDEVIKPPRPLPGRGAGYGAWAPDPVLQSMIGGPAPSGPALADATPSAPTLGTNHDGVGNVDGVLPPDTNGDVGPNHYVQTVQI